jgi:hypothetical protein
VRCSAGHSLPDLLHVCGCLHLEPDTPLLLLLSLLLLLLLLLLLPLDRAPLLCRARLSYEQFSQFLEAIKDLNAGRASREDTLGAAQGLFGPGNADLYGE